jgi:4'-phosphopantetheinyl transferase EntD
VLSRGGPILKDESGAPVLPGYVEASISHKRDLAVCLARRGDGGEDFSRACTVAGPAFLT